MKEKKEMVIETIGLTKHYGKVKAVDNVSLSVRKGEIYGFLGLNGAGKTTTIRILLGMVRPFSGEARLFGETVTAGKKGPWDKVGYLVEMPYSYPELTVLENLKVFCRYRNIRNKDVLSGIVDKLKLEEYLNVKAKNLSLGNAQRLGLAKALVHSPEILILDEPSNGLDPAGIVEIRELLTGLAQEEGVTVFISSHNLGEISKIATRIGIIHRGKLVQEIDSGSLEPSLHQRLLISCKNRDKAAAFLSQKGFVTDNVNGGAMSLHDRKAVEDPGSVNRLLVEAGHAPDMLYVEREDLETYFLRIIGEGI